MHVVIIGNGVAGQTAAEKIRKASEEIEIDMFAKEPYPYYSRIFLPHYIANERPIEKLILRDENWYQEKSIRFHEGVEVTAINPEKKSVLTSNSDEPMHYDKLIIATGSNARKLDFGNPDVQGMYTLRNINDADSIKEYIHENKVQHIVIIGGGLLGIELGYHLKALNIHVTICEIQSYLLPRQLDEETSRILQKYLESQGLHIICGEAAKTVIGDPKVTGIEFKSGKTLECDMILQQMGIIPEISLAQSANLDTQKGIMVNEYMQTSHPDIYAAGDCVQFKGLIWGIIPASMEQSSIAVDHLLGNNPDPYQGSFWNTRLKIAGINLSCLGEPPTNLMEEEKLLKNVDVDHYICRKVVMDKNTLKGAIIMGPGSDKFFLKNLGKNVDESQVKKEMEIE